MSKDSMSCDRARLALTTRDFRTWAGLPIGCDAEPLLGVAPSPAAELPRILVGGAFRELRFQMLEWPGYHRVRACFAEGTVALIDGEIPELATSAEDLKAALGEPAARLDSHFGTLPLPGGEWVYPTRGITVLWNTDRDRVFRIWVYAPTDLTTYEATLRLKLAVERRPLRR